MPNIFSLGSVLRIDSQCRGLPLLRLRSDLCYRCLPAPTRLAALPRCTTALLPRTPPPSTLLSFCAGTPTPVPRSSPPPSTTLLLLFAVPHVAVPSRSSRPRTRPPSFYRRVLVPMRHRRTDSFLAMLPLLYIHPLLSHLRVPVLTSPRLATSHFCGRP